MTYVSPINSKIIKASKAPNSERNYNYNDRVYHELITKANEIKPNKPKAVLVHENPIQGCVNSVKDFFQDGKNFFTAVKTGKMDDHSLGRINDFGMKLGGLGIATFLASRAQTKTAAIMSYLGGATFFASMSLWPKLFINLPARLVHGFRIDDKYISAQGEKKDFFLDNQFIPWDAYPEEELRKNAKRAGIDYDEKNGDEKIKTKMQKTALQNRTLWMATAGSATPLMTALIGDAVEPQVRKAVIKSGLKKSQKALENFDEVMANAKPIVRNQNEINGIIGDFESGAIDCENMFTSLAKKLNLNLEDVFINSDDKKALEFFQFSVTPDMLKTVREAECEITNKNTTELIKNALTGSALNDAVSKAPKLGAAKVKSAKKLFDESTVNSIITEFNNSTKKTYKTLSDIATKYAKQKGINPGVVTTELAKVDFEYNYKPFFDTVKEFNVNVLGKIRGRIKTYLQDILNPVAGMRDESLFTEMYRESMKKSLPKEETSLLYSIKSKLGKRLGLFKDKAKSELSSTPIANKNTIEGLVVEKGEAVSKLVETAIDDAHLGKLYEVGTNKEAHTTLLGDLGTWLSRNIKEFTNIATINIDAIRSKSLIAENLEQRISSGDFKASLENAGLISKEFPLEEWVKKARYLVNKGTVAADACKMGLKNENLFNTLRNIIYDSSKFGVEREKLPEIENVLSHLRDLNNVRDRGMITPKDSAFSTGLKNLQNTISTELKNNRSWKKIVIPAAAVLVAVTLLVQPLFGSIKKEFPDEGNGGRK